MFSFHEWNKRRHERHEAEEERLRNTYVSCKTYKDWRRNALIGYVVLFVGLGINSVIDRERGTQSRTALAESGNVVSVVGCNRDFRLYQKVRAVFNQSLKAITEQHDQGLTTDEQYARQRDFYLVQLSNFALPDCRDVAGTLTDDPTEKVDQPPKPLYPGAPEAEESPFDPKPNG
jgi:hypothetical protein